MASYFIIVIINGTAHYLMASYFIIVIINGTAHYLMASVLPLTG